MSPARVVIADDEPLIRRALAELISSAPELELAGEAADAEGAIGLVRELRPDIALVDVRMPRGGGPRAAREIRSCSPLTRVVALSAYTDRETVIEMVRSGAAGYVVKGSPGDQVVDALVRCARGESMLSAEIAGEVVAELSRHLEREQSESDSWHTRVDRIRRVLDDGGLTTVFQPIARLTTGRAVGVEALSRFPDDLPGPEAWFDSAESVGLRTELEIHAARAALARLPSLPDDLYLAVNVSPATLGELFALDLEPEAARRIVLEVTEHARIDDYGDITRTVSDLRDGGVRIAVDDVGAGFANLKHILHLTPDVIKLDASLTRAVHMDRSRRALTRALISFAAELGATIVAEGIETGAELDALLELGVEYGQGYYIARPAAFEEVLQSRP